MTFLQELKRRNVFRVAIGYAIIAWLLLQVTDLVLENITAPDWVMQVFMLALAIGFPLAVFFAWAFEMTPEGIKREHEVERSESIAHLTGHKLDRAIIVVLVLALGYFVFDKFMSGAGQQAAGTATEVAAVNTESPRDRKSIAVLPFANRSSRQEDQFFSDGIHDDLLTSLAKVGSLKVISRTSVMRYRGSGMSIPEIARELGVATVLEGGIQRSANQVRINVQLIDAQTDEHLWAENYDRELTAENLFAIQSEIAREIVAALRATLSDQESQRLDAKPTTSLEAYGEYVLGRQENARRTVESLQRAQAHFEKAIELDPNYTLAYVGLADALNLQAYYGNLGFVDSYAPRQAAVDKALALDPDSGEVYTSLAALRMDEFKDQESERYFQKAIGLSPNYATAYHWYSFLLDRMDRYEAALPMIRKAVELDPMAPILSTQLARVLWNMGRVEESTAVLLESIRRNPQFPNFYATMTNSLQSLGRLGEAMQWARAAAKLDSTNVFAVVMECLVYVQLADGEAAERCFNAAEEAYPETASGWRINLYQFRSQLPKALAQAKERAKRIPGPFADQRLGYNYIANGELEKARALIEDQWPGLLGNEDIVVGPDNGGPVLIAAFSLYGLGELERANYLFDQALAWMQTTHRIRGAGYEVSDVFVHVTRGEKQKAISALRDAIDSGWRENWFRLRYPLYDSMLDEPEWVELLTKLEADIARQRQWFENHKDDPLF